MCPQDSEDSVENASFGGSYNGHMAAMGHWVGLIKTYIMLHPRSHRMI